MSNRENSERNNALEKMQALCSRSEKCKEDIRQKLKNYTISDPGREWILQKLEKEKFVDDKRYAGYFVKDKFRLNKWGRIKIRHALIQKKISEEVINEVLAEINEEDYSNALMDLIRQKNGGLNDNNIFTRKGKLLRYATQKGFETDRVYEAIDKVLGEEDRGGANSRRQ